MLPANDEADADEVAVLVTAGADVGQETVTEAAGEMTATGAQVMDLLPADLPAERALRLLRWVDASWLGRDPFYAPGGAHEAVVMHEDVARRMGIGTKAAGDAHPGEPLDRSEVVRATVSAQRHAQLRSGIRVAPGLRASSQGPVDRWQEWEALTLGSRNFVVFTPFLAGVETVHLLAMTAGLLVAPLPALAALVTWSVQPHLVFGPGDSGASGQPARTSWVPPDLGRAGVSRLPRAWARNLATVLAGAGLARAKAAERSRTPVPDVPPPEELFEPRRDSCPWCDSTSIVGRLDTTDLFLQRSGEFHLDQCSDCGHTFQNPALTIKGLDYYYDQFYDGTGGEFWLGVNVFGSEHHDTHIETMERFCTPRAWLDVGTGHAHFCLLARQRWPEAVFDGLDISESVEAAERRGWIDTAYRGLFPELAGSLPRSYDVVSMHHYLEHTRDPRLEIAAAAKVLEPGGLLEIEVPDPESPWARRLGRYWICWFQPQHLHFVPRDNLIAALQEQGFEIVACERGSSPVPLELTPAVWFVAQHLTRSPHLPWLPAASLADRAKRIAVLGAALPWVPVAGVIDAVIQARLGPDDTGSAYRVVARKP